MKKMLLFATSLLALTACEKSEPAGGEPRTLSFESLVDFTGVPVTLGHAVVQGYVNYEYDDVFWGKDYATDAVYDFGGGVTAAYKLYHGLLFADRDRTASFGSCYDNGQQWGGTYDTWSGFVVSGNCDRTAASVDYANQFSAWAGSGANGTSSFAVGCCSTYSAETDGLEYAIPTVEFSSPCVVESFWVANSTVAYPYRSQTFDDAYLRLTVIGSRGGRELYRRTVTLADASGKISDWTRVVMSGTRADASPYSARVDRLTFMVESNDEMYPTYFCLDEITVR